MALLLARSGQLLYLVGMNVFLRTRLFRDAIGADPGLFARGLHERVLALAREHPRRGPQHPGARQPRRVDLAHRPCRRRRGVRGSRAQEVPRGPRAGRRRQPARWARASTAVTPETMSALPPVPGFDHPPLTDVGPPSPPLADSTYNLWSVELDDVVATRVREVWIDTIARRRRSPGPRAMALPAAPVARRGTGHRSTSTRSTSPSAPSSPGPPASSDGSGSPSTRSTSRTVASEAVVDQVSVLGELERHGGGRERRQPRHRGRRGRRSPMPLARFGVRADVDHGDPPSGGPLSHGALRCARDRRRLRLPERRRRQPSSSTRTAWPTWTCGSRRSRLSAVSGGGPARARVASLAATFTSRHVPISGSSPSPSRPTRSRWTGPRPTRCLLARAPPHPGGPRGHLGSGDGRGRLEGRLRDRTGKGHVTFAGAGWPWLTAWPAVGGGPDRDRPTSTARSSSDRVDLSDSRASLRDTCVRRSEKSPSTPRPSTRTRSTSSSRRHRPHGARGGGRARGPRPVAGGCWARCSRSPRTWPSKAGAARPRSTWTWT